MADKKAQLIIEGAAPVELPILTGTVGPDVIDVRGLTATGRFTFDPGFMSTASCESKITYIDGDQGILLHRGYPIEQLAEKSDYLETCFLLLNGELPNAAEKEQFVNTIKNHTMVHEQLKSFLNGFRRDAHPMAIMCGVVGALSAFYHDSLDINDAHHREVSAMRLIAKMPTNPRVEMMEWASKRLTEVFIAARLADQPDQPQRKKFIYKRYMDLILVFRGGLCVNSRHLSVRHRMDALTLQRRRTNASICRPVQCASNRRKPKYHLRGPSDFPSRSSDRLGFASPSLSCL